MNFEFAESVIEDGAKHVKSLVWDGDSLVDWCQGGVSWGEDGKRRQSTLMTAYSFDAAVVSPSGKYVCIYCRTQTKGVIRRTEDRKRIREINRSFYFAHVYEFPAVFARLDDGREVLIHCPEAYNRLEIEEVESGARLGYSKVAESTAECGSESADNNAKCERRPADVFHSCLSSSPNGKWLVSNGWYWHPHETVEVFPVSQCAAEARLLDKSSLIPPGCPLVQSASFVDDDRLIVGCGEEWFDEAGKEIRIQDSKQAINTIAVWRIGQSTFEKVVHLECQTGTLMALSDRYVVDLMNHPKLIDLDSAEIVQSWPQIKSGTKTSCITRANHLPPIAIDSPNRRVAIHNEETIHILRAYPRT